MILEIKREQVRTIKERDNEYYFVNFPIGSKYYNSKKEKEKVS